MDNCEFKLFNSIPAEAQEIRKTFFVKEQGFADEFDETDNTAYHVVAFVNGDAAATCRFFRNTESEYTIGRIAVLKQYRGKNLGSRMLEAAEKIILENGGRSVSLHAQLRATGFYEKLGYSSFGEADEEQGCPHIRMRKDLPGI